MSLALGQRPQPPLSPQDEPDDAPVCVELNEDRTLMTINDAGEAGQCIFTRKEAGEMLDLACALWKEMKP